ncbi:FAD-binding protein [Glutamicibacter halophytocola]|uniref:FAD-binding protein n=1 Tax=Glutamicibacter halophytocola TaxID=1933880 RepID=A0ABX5YBV6_9MICC|nr:FAD-binding protein [Glutamicibacter halophytocola]QDY67135.1 FAD-binding protein [Glutamicibacter halophytocola]
MKLETRELNWAGNLEYRASQLLYPTSVEQLQEQVRAATKVRALGSRHSFNGIADTSETLISLSKMPEVIEIDAKAMSVRVSGGTTYGALADALEQAGFALHNLASLPHISVAGAVSTGTHGSGEAHGNLATAVSAVELVLADGSQLSAKRGDPQFDGYVVSLGSLGVMTHLTLDIVPSFDVQQTVYEQLSWDKVLDNFAALQASAYSVSLFTDWSGELVGQTWLKRRVGDGLVDDIDQGKFGGFPATAAMHPLPGADGAICSEQLGAAGPWSDRLPHFRMDFMPSAGDELQTEYLVPREHAVAAMAAMRQLSPVLTPLLLVAEVRTIAADDLWLSGNYGRDGIALHFTWKPQQQSVEAILPQVESALAPYAARPHWGKLFAATAADLRGMYPKFNDFIALARRLDPDGKFRNEFLQRNIFGA